MDMSRTTILLLLVLGLAACVPTTRYRYVPATADAVALARTSKVMVAPFAMHSTAICWPDGHAELVRDATVKGDRICAQFKPPVGGWDGRKCMPLKQLAGIGIPYESHAFSVVPYMGVEVGRCDPAKLRKARKALLKRGM